NHYSFNDGENLECNSELNYSHKSRTTCVTYPSYIRIKKGLTQPTLQLAFLLLGLKEGILWKRGRDNELYQPRRFLLSEKERCLKYFVKQDAKEPKIEVKIDTVNAMFQTEKMRHSNGLQITYLKHNKTRNIFVYHEDGKEIVDWFNTIRAVKFHHLKVAFPGANDVISFLDHRRLMYFKDPLDAFAKGEVFLGNGEQGYNVKKGLPHAMQGGFTWKHGIIIVTPDRKYIFTCETEKEQEEWKSVFSHVMEQPMTPQEYVKHNPDEALNEIEFDTPGLNYYAFTSHKARGSLR
uniref:PH domain-containing protein n=1 Tax=Laticauda laticaudata TaxID=8630 RepID=A0A8C5SHI1_LATLA